MDGALLFLCAPAKSADMEDDLVQNRSAQERAAVP
jgi:hypothetical protein